MASLAKIRQWCESGELPESAEFFEEFTDGKLFIPNEGLLWDFKDRWPFSYSDGYFGGIARLICAFSNTLGGIIIFGVDDRKRNGGHNKVIVNFDKLALSFEQLTGERPNLTVKSYRSEIYGDVTALLVMRRPLKSRPYRFMKKVENYSSGILWIRSGHEVVPANPQHYPVLFCRAGYDLHEQDKQTKLSGSLPPNPNTLAKFIGRSESLDLLFHWLISSDEPRKYLYGKGGSGKTAIAYEFAKLLENYGQSIEIDGG